MSPRRNQAERDACVRAETTPGLPVLEKLVLGCSIAWMALTVATVYPQRVESEG